MKAIKAHAGKKAHCKEKKKEYFLWPLMELLGFGNSR